MSKKQSAPQAPKKQEKPQVQLQKEEVELTLEHEINFLREAHQFFAQYQGVPGIVAFQWGVALDKIARVANSVISKAGLLEPKPQAPENGAAPADNTQNPS